MWNTISGIETVLLYSGRLPTAGLHLWPANHSHSTWHEPLIVTHSSKLAEAVSVSWLGSLFDRELIDQHSIIFSYSKLNVNKSNQIAKISAFAKDTRSFSLELERRFCTAAGGIKPYCWMSYERYKISPCIYKSAFPLLTLSRSSLICRK